ncbi:glycoside hydrolase family 27 protein [Rufibacter radiotolerans]|uniref:glycoside hydrolase family 27 protein n=1 Tax=Rufibacter radiotolerans TaxID=1379910 RepID=UPI0006646EEB|nr:glycoside hydrolase family 27 protein [Rufibacter radiotolerans]
MRIVFTFFLALLGTFAQAQVSPALAPSPPMGWNSWNWFGKEAINEKMVREVIDAMAASGLRDAGYTYVVVDGGWRDTKLGPNGELLPHPQRFPGGMKALADYAHSKGLKFGLHTTPGSHDCGMDKVGGWGYEEVHVKQFADWGLDFLKLDKCRFSLDEQPTYPRNDPRWKKGWESQPQNLQTAYAKWSSLLKASGRAMVLSASAYQFFPWYPALTHMGRTTGDIKSKQSGGAVFDSEKPGSVMAIAGKNNQHVQKAGKGYWNDPDMLVTGEQGLTQEEQKSHFALWSIMSAPLILGNDPRVMKEEEKKIILKKEAIAINQDPTEQGKRITAAGKAEVWAKKLKNGDYAVLLLNRDAAAAQAITVTWAQLGLSGSRKVRDVYAAKSLGTAKDKFSQTIPPRSSLFLVMQAR